MSRCIDADKLLEYLEKEAESEDVKPVIHAHWKERKNHVIDGFEWAICSHCKNLVPVIPYCGFCGAKMDEVTEE